MTLLVTLLNPSALELQDDNSVGTSSEEAPSLNLRETIWGNGPLDYSCEPLFDLNFSSEKPQKCDQGDSAGSEPHIRAHLCPQAKHLDACICRKNLTRDHDSPAKIWAVQPECLLCFVSKRLEFIKFQMVVAQGC